MEVRQLHDVDISRLRVFMAVVDSGGFAAAQAELGVSAATISVRMSELEQTLGVRLCKRGRAGFWLTRDGETVYSECLQLFRAHEKFRSSVDNLRGLLSGELRVGVIDNIVFDPDCPLSSALARLKDASDDLKLSLYTMEPLELQRAVIEQRVNIAIGVFYKKVQTLNFHPLFRERLYLYCGIGNDLFDAEESEITPEAIARLPCVERTYGQTIKRANSAHYLHAGAWSSSLEAAATLILSGRYIGFLPDYYAKIWESKGQMKALLPQEFYYDSEICIVTRKDQADSILVNTMSRILREQQE